MSVKRQATSELNHENWDDDDPSDDKSMGQFRAASKDVLEKRVIRTAKRRNPISAEASKSVFSGFGGFNKTQKTSFDFLANLTNGSKNTNGSTTTSSSESATTSSLFTNKPAATSGGLFGAQSSSITSKPLQTTTWSSPFGSAAKNSSSSLFSANTEIASKKTPYQIAQPNSQTKPAQASGIFGATSTPAPECKTLTTTTNSSSFKIQPISNTTTATVQTTSGVSTPSAPTIAPEKKPVFTEYVKIYHEKLRSLNVCVSEWISLHVEQSPVCILTPIFDNYEEYLTEITKEYHDAKQKEAKDQAKTDNGANATKSQSGQNNSGSSTNASKDTKTSMVFGINNSTLSTSSNQDKVSPFAINNSSPVKTQDSKPTTSDSKSSGLFTFSNMPKQDTKTTTLFGVNSTESKQESKSTPFALNTDSTPKKSEDTKLSTSFGIANNSNQDNKISSPFAMSNTSTSVFSASPKTSDTKVNTPFAMNAGSSPFNSSTPKPSPFGVQNNSLTSTENNQPSFSFGIKTSSADTSATKPNTGFSFGVASSGSSLFSSTSTPQSTTSFSFGTGKPFSFSTNNVQQSGGESAAKEEPESEEPPKVEYTPVNEENSVYDKKCKIFVKKDGNFVDKGVGTLYLKTIEGNAKHQLLVRANTNLGTVLVNLVLSEGIPIQRMGKNNVMMVCIPTPDANPPPTPILIRVKTGEEADELLETLNKHTG